MDLICNLLSDHVAWAGITTRGPRHFISWYKTFGLTLYSLCPAPVPVTRYLQGHAHIWF